MKIKEATILRFQEICQERGMKFNSLATNSGVTPSTVYSMMKSEREDLSIITVKKLVDGLDMSICDFFDSDIFRNLDQEIN